MELDYNQIFDGITLALHAAFPDKQIFGGTVRQGVQPGDLNVVPVNINETAQIGTRAQRTAIFDVIYYPPDAQSMEACLDMQHKITQALGTVTTPNGDKVHCLRFSCTIEDVLHCTATYPHFVYKAVATDKMEHLTVESTGGNYGREEE